MRYFFTAPSLTAPTFETLQEHTLRRFSKVERLLNNIKRSDVSIKITVTKERNQFCICTELYIGNLKKEIIVKVKDPDLRRSIDKAAQQLKNEIIKAKEKRTNLSRVRNAKDELKKQLLDNLE